MSNKEIVINQALHGYRQGHELLASSLELLSNDKRKMLYLSDSSGSEFSELFDGYLEGYPLSDDKYVLSRTWRASEMKRPGCVWTHSLIVDRGDFKDLKNLSDLFIYFKRPDLTEDFSLYKKKISISCRKSSNPDMEASFVDLAYTYVLSPEKQIIIPVKDKEKLEKNFLSFWELLNGEQKLSLSFCTGYFSLNQPPKESFQIVFIPQNGKRFSWDKNTAIYLDEGKFFLNDSVDQFPDDYKEIILFSFKAKGLSQDSIENAKQLYNLARTESVADWMKIAPMLESNSDFAIKLFGPEEYRFKAVKNISECDLLKIVISYRFLRDNDIIDALKRVKSLSADEAFDIFQYFLSLPVSEGSQDFSVKLYQLLPSLQHAQFGHAPIWFMVHLITEEQPFNISSLWSLPNDEILSVLSRSLIENKAGTINLLEKNKNIANNKKIDLWLLQNIEENEFESIVNKFNIDVLQLPYCELQKLILRFPLKILSSVSLDSVPEKLAYDLFSNSFRAGSRDLFIEKLSTLESLSKIDWGGELWFKIISHIYEYDQPGFNNVFLKIYPHVLNTLSSESLKERYLRWSDILPFGVFFKTFTPIDKLRLTLLKLVISRRVSIADFLSCLISKDEVKDTSLLIDTLNSYDRRKFRSLLVNYSGPKREEDKVHYLLGSIDDD